MSQQENSNGFQWIFVAALLLIGILVIVALVNVKSQADTPTASTTITNSAPTVTAVYVNSTATYAEGYTLANPITPTAGGTVTVYVTGEIVDANGVYTASSGTPTAAQLFATGASGDLTSLKVTLRHDGADASGTNTSGGRTKAGCDASAETDKNNCYYSFSDASGTATGGNSTGGTCTFSVQSVTTVRFFCPFTIAAWIDATKDTTASSFDADFWEARVYVDDDSADAVVEGASAGTAAAGRIEVAPALGLSIPTTISYGALALGTTTGASDNTSISITQNSNDVQDVNVSATTNPNDGSTDGRMACTILGSIAVGSQKWALTDTTYAASTALTTSAVDTNLAVPLGAVDAGMGNTATVLYWNIAIPSTGVAGVCSGYTTITALAGA